MNTPRGSVVSARGAAVVSGGGVVPGLFRHHVLPGRTRCHDCHSMYAGSGPGEAAAFGAAQRAAWGCRSRGDSGSEDRWWDRGLCCQTDPDAFFPDKGGATGVAKRICRGCELEYALAHDERFGVWGGLSERERRRLRRRVS